MESVQLPENSVVVKLDDKNTCEFYHRFYYNTLVWDKIKYRGHRIWKSVSDLWLYQEIIWDLKPSLIIEFGSAFGGSALYFRDCLSKAGVWGRVVSCDIDLSWVPKEISDTAGIEFVLGSSVSVETAEVLRRRVGEFPGRIFAILDSYHRKDHVFAEMMLMRELLKSGDYLVVEDTNVETIVSGYGDGPLSAIKEYEAKYPADYVHDLERENKFGWTFAPYGFMVRA